MCGTTQILGDMGGDDEDLERLRPPEELRAQVRGEGEALAEQQRRELEELKAKVRDDEGDDFEMKENPFEEENEEPATESKAGKVVECQECGFTLLIGKGRESKFFGKDFKCPECGASKSKFATVG